MNPQVQDVTQITGLFISFQVHLCSFTFDIFLSLMHLHPLDLLCGCQLFHKATFFFFFCPPGQRHTWRGISWWGLVSSQLPEDPCQIDEQVTQRLPRIVIRAANHHPQRWRAEPLSHTSMVTDLNSKGDAAVIQASVCLCLQLCFLMLSLSLSSNPFPLNTACSQTYFLISLFSLSRDSRIMPSSSSYRPFSLKCAGLGCWLDFKQHMHAQR